MGMLLLITTPIYYSQGYQLSVDPLRVYLFFLSIVWLIEGIKENSPRQLAISGIVVGLSMYSHQMGILTLPFFMAVYFLRSREKLPRKAISLGIVLVMALVIGGSRYISNYQSFGSPFTPTVPLFKSEKLGYDEHFRHLRGYTSMSDRVVYGAIQGFTKFKSFG